MAKSRFSEVCEGAGKTLLMLAEQSRDCDEPVLFDRKAFQPNIQVIADVLAEFSKVKLQDF
jgi:hypothetical protein